MKFKLLSLSMLTAFLLAAVLAPDALAQRREHLTSEEIELVRDVQDVDFRMEIFVKAIERRLMAISGESALTEEQKKQISKDEDKWGPLPTGSQSELISDIEKILNEAIDKFENDYEIHPDNDLLPYAYFIISDYSEALIPRLQKLGETTTDIRQIGMLENAAGYCTDIIAVRDKFQRPTVKRKKRKSAS